METGEGHASPLGYQRIGLLKAYEVQIFNQSGPASHITLKLEIVEGCRRRWRSCQQNTTGLPTLDGVLCHDGPMCWCYLLAHLICLIDFVLLESPLICPFFLFFFGVVGESRCSLCIRCDKSVSSIIYYGFCLQACNPLLFLWSGWLDVCIQLC